MLHCVALVRTDVSEEHSTSIIWVTRIGELGTMFAVTVTANIVPSLPILVTLMMEVIHFSKMSDLIRATQCNIPEDDVLQFHSLYMIMLLQLMFGRTNSFHCTVYSSTTALTYKESTNSDHMAIRNICYKQGSQNCRS
jgi:hypothetical protein